MKSTKWLIALACVLPVLGFILTAMNIAETIRGYSMFLQNRSLTPQDIKTATGIVSHQLASAWRYTAAGLIGGLIPALVLIVRHLRHRGTPPSPSMQEDTTIGYVLFAILASLAFLGLISVPINIARRYQRVQQETEQVRAAVQEAVRREEAIVKLHQRTEFTLTTRLLQPQQQGASPRLAIELQNISGQPQRVIMLTNLFEGAVYLSATNGEVHDFIQTNYLNMVLTGLWFPPTVELAPGGSYHWEHALSEFVDSHRMRTVHVGNEYRIIYPVLADEFRSDCEIWCTFDVRQRKMLNESNMTDVTTASVVSTKVRHPEK